MALRGLGWPTGQRGAARAEQGVRRGFWAEEEEGSASGPGWSERQGGTQATRGERFQRAERVGGASRDVGRRGEWVGLSCGKREGAGLVWAGPQGLDGFLVLGFLSISPFFYF